MTHPTIIDALQALLTDIGRGSYGHGQDALHARIWAIYDNAITGAWADINTDTTPDLEMRRWAIEQAIHAGAQRAGPGGGNQPNTELAFDPMGQIRQCADQLIAYVNGDG